MSSHYIYAFLLFILLLQNCQSVYMRKDGETAPVRPFFLLFCATSCVWISVYQPKDDRWVRMWSEPCFYSLILVKLLAVAECLCILSSGIAHLRNYLLGTSGLAIAWIVTSWEIKGYGLTRMIQARNFLQVGTFCFLLVPMLVLWAESRGGRRSMRYGWFLLGVLGVNAAISLAVMRHVPISHNTWVMIDYAAYFTTILFSCRLIALDTPRFQGIEPYSERRHSMIHQSDLL